MILIENELIFLSVPKNASIAVHYALEDSDIKIEPAFRGHDMFVDSVFKRDGNFTDSLKLDHKIKIHTHLTTAEVYSTLNKKLPTIFIKRDYSERFVSALNYIFNFRIPLAYPELKKILHNIDNDWLYQNINSDVINNILIYNPADISFFKDGIESPEDFVHKSIISSLNKFLKRKIEIKSPSSNIKSFPENKYINFKMLDSQEIYKSGYTPKYIFDIKELDKLEKLMYEKYGKMLKIKKINNMTQKNIKTNFIHDTKLKNWVWNNFEKHHFIKKIF
jgi:hypothetical protein